MNKKGKFVKQKQLQLFRNLSQELVQHWLNIHVLYFKINMQNIKINIYGQTIGPKQFYPALSIPGLIQHNPLQFQFMDAFVTNTTNFKFLKSTLQKYNIYPDIGDFIVWNERFWQVGNTTQEQLIGGAWDTQWTIVCQTTLVSDTKVQELAIFTDKKYRYGKQE